MFTTPLTIYTLSLYTYYKSTHKHDSPIVHIVVNMDALCNSAGHYIFALWFLLSIFYLFSSPNLSRLPHFHTWCSLSANLGCRSETCCTRLAENTGRKKSPKIRHLGTIAQLCRAISLQLRQISTIGKKLVKHQCLSHMSS